MPRCQKPYLPGKESVIPLGHHGRVPEAATENWGASEENFAEYAGSAQDYQAPIRSQGIQRALRFLIADRLWYLNGTTLAEPANRSMAGRPAGETCR